MGKWSDLAGQKSTKSTGKWSQLESQQAEQPARETDALKDIEPLPEADVGLPSAETVAPLARPVLEYGGLTAGAAIGAATGGPIGGAAGAGLGYGIGRQLADILEQQTGLQKQKTLTDELVESTEDVAAGAMMEMGGQVFGKLASQYGAPTARKLDKVVRQGISKAIRPSVTLQRTAAQARHYYGRAKNAIGAIIANKNNLQLTNAEGQVVSGLPKTLNQFAEAIEQTKQMIFREYDEMARVAGKQGLQVDLGPAVRELEAGANDKVMQDLMPRAVKYAAETAENLGSRRVYTATEAQRAIERLNQNLKAFYRNPSPDTTTNAYIDALIANNIRKSLDEGISQISGPGYQELKNLYGSLVHIETDVMRRAVVDARKNIKGLIDFSDIFSGSEVIRGLMARDPSMVGMGVTAKGIASFYRKLNDPNRIVKNLFQEAEGIIGKQISPDLPAGKELVGRTAGYLVDDSREIQPQGQGRNQ